MLLPFAYSISALSPAAERIPSSNVPCREGVHVILHIPHILLRASAIGRSGQSFLLCPKEADDDRSSTKQKFQLQSYGRKNDVRPYKVFPGYAEYHNIYTDRRITPIIFSFQDHDGRPHLSVLPSLFLLSGILPVCSENHRKPYPYLSLPAKHVWKLLSEGRHRGGHFGYRIIICHQ